MTDSYPDAALPAGSGVELTVLMPCLDEAETIGTCVESAMAYLSRAGVAGEVLVADNGSADDSRAIAESRGARVVVVREKGYGSAIRGGIEQARGRYIVMGDADASYDFTALDSFLEKLRAGYQLVMGNRFKGGIAPDAMPLLHRYLGNPLLSAFGRLFFRSPIGDFHCGLRGFDREAVRQLGLSTTGMEFASEMVVKATLNGLRITEVPTTLSQDGRSRAPHLRSWSDGWRHLRFLLLLSPRWLFLYPGITLWVLGLVIMVWLLPGPQRIASVTFDVHTLAYATAAMICGFQAIVFALFAATYAIKIGVLPPEPRLIAFSRLFSLEIGLVAGLVFVAGGIGTSIYAVASWGEAAFAGLDASVTMRVVLPAVASLILGLQAIFASFFFSVLGLAPR